MLGSAVGVLPIAAISDRIDRRLVIAAVMIAGAASETGLSRVAAPGAWLLVLGFLVGLTTYSLYTLAVSLANDHGAPHDLIFISVGLLFIYCVAAIAAPALASLLMKHFGPRMLFIPERLRALGHRGARPLGTFDPSSTSRYAAGLAALALRFTEV